MKKLLLIFVMMATWMGASCATTTENGGCFGFWKSNGPKRGTLEKNKFNKHPYRQCVDENPPHQDTYTRSYG